MAAHALCKGLFLKNTIELEKPKVVVRETI
jgi:hypothetical protein